MKRIVMAAACFFSLAQASQPEDTKQAYETFERPIKAERKPNVVIVSEEPLKLAATPDKNEENILYACPFCSSSIPSLLSSDLIPHVENTHSPLTDVHEGFLYSVEQALASKELPDTFIAASQLRDKHTIQPTT